MTFEYKQQVYIQRVKCKYLKQVKAGDRIEMQHIENTSTFLFKEENIDFDTLSNLILALMGVIIIVISVRKKK